MSAPTGLDRAEITALLERWTAGGFIDAELADRMRADVTGPGTDREPVAADRRRAVAVEALAYLGSTVVVAGAALIAAQYWSDIAPAARLAVVAGTSVALLVAGGLVPGQAGGAWARLRAVLFLASTAGATGALALLADNVLGLAPDDSLVLLSTGTTAYAVGLWVVTRSPAQQVAMMVAGAVTAAALIKWASQRRRASRRSALGEEERDPAPFHDVAPHGSESFGPFPAAVLRWERDRHGQGDGRRRNAPGAAAPGDRPRRATGAYRRTPGARLHGDRPHSQRRRDRERADQWRRRSATRLGR